jgi:hypothetical protein
VPFTRTQRCGPAELRPAVIALCLFGRPVMADALRMPWRRPASASAVVVLAFGGVSIAGCTAHGSPQAVPRVAKVAAGPTRLTGFVSMPVGMSFVPRRAITVRVAAAEASQLKGLAFALPKSAPAVCHGGGRRLIYRILFGSTPSSGRTIVDGYVCGGQVAIRQPGAPPSWRRDTSCDLLTAVRGSLPPKAKATQSLTVGCTRRDGMAD